MSATGGVENATVELLTTEVVGAEQSQPAEKPKAPREKKPKTAKTATHPPYFQMIKEALLALNDKSGSSPHAIAKYMEEKLKAVLPANFRKILGLQLKNSAAKGKLIKVKASYKLSESGKTEKGATKVPKPDAAKKLRKTRSATATNGAPKAKAAKKSETVKKTAKPAKKVAKSAKKVVAARKTKKSAPAKAKQPKSIKSPAAKKAKKAAA